MSRAQVLAAVRNLDLSATREILRGDAALAGTKDRSGRNLLHLVCSASCKDVGVSESSSARIAELLLERGLDVESTLVMDEYPCNSVWFAVARGRNPTLVKLLVKRGATPRGLFAAGWYDDVKMVNLLIRLGAAVDEQAEDETPFLHCWKNGRFRAARVLVKQGADVNFQDSTGKTALHYGVRKAFSRALLKGLVRSGASPDIEDGQGISARLLASRKRDKRFLKALS